jgi:hypothetical protein
MVAEPAERLVCIAAAVLARPAARFAGVRWDDIHARFGKGYLDTYLVVLTLACTFLPLSWPWSAGCSSAMIRRWRTPSPIPCPVASASPPTRRRQTHRGGRPRCARWGGNARPARRPHHAGFWRAPPPPPPRPAGKPALPVSRRSQGCPVGKAPWLASDLPAASAYSPASELLCRPYPSACRSPLAGDAPATGQGIGDSARQRRIMALLQPADQGQDKGKKVQAKVKTTR